MCGRYALAIEHELLRIRYGFAPGAITIEPRYNIAPSQVNPVVTSGMTRELKLMQWGLIPHWAKEPSIGNKLINARADTVHEKPSFRDSLKTRRCLIPATGFFEWAKAKDDRIKRPMYIYVVDEKMFSFAGLWSSWKSPQGADILTYTILTTEPNEFMKRIHHRMPVILEREDEEHWLSEKLPNHEEMRKILRPFSSERMEAIEVSRVVNSPQNDFPECIEKVA
jgi:putative SOS response-associated peptidase YedK